MARAGLWTAWAVAVTCAVGGCGTLMNLSNESDPSPAMKKLPLGVYGGVQADAQIGKGYLKECFSGRYPAWANLYGFSVGSYLLSVDLPLSLVGDTLTLPWSVVAELNKTDEPAASLKKDSDRLETRDPATPAEQPAEQGKEP